MKENPHFLQSLRAKSIHHSKKYIFIEIRYWLFFHPRCYVPVCHVMSLRFMSFANLKVRYLIYKIQINLVIWNRYMSKDNESKDQHSSWQSNGRSVLFPSLVANILFFKSSLYCQFQLSIILNVKSKSHIHAFFSQNREGVYSKSYLFSKFCSLR